MQATNISISIRWFLLLPLVYWTSVCPQINSRMIKVNHLHPTLVSASLHSRTEPILCPAFRVIYFITPSVSHTTQHWIIWQFVSINLKEFQTKQSSSNSWVHKFSKNLGITKKIVSARRVTWSKFHTEDPQILSTIPQNSEAPATWCVGFVHPWPMVCSI